MEHVYEILNEEQKSTIRTRFQHIRFDRDDCSARVNILLNEPEPMDTNEQIKRTRVFLGFLLESLYTSKILTEIDVDKILVETSAFVDGLPSPEEMKQSKENFMQIGPKDL